MLQGQRKCRLCRLSGLKLFMKCCQRKLITFALMLKNGSDNKSIGGKLLKVLGSLLK